MKINIKKHLGVDRYLDNSIILKAKSSINTWGGDDVIWVEEYKGQTITVNLPNGNKCQFAKITKPDNK